MSQTMPKRVEKGLCPGLEGTMREVANELDALVITAHAGGEHPGAWQDCGCAPCHPFRSCSDKLRDSLYEWTGSGS